jgi:hypothetical protein
MTTFRPLSRYFQLFGIWSLEFGIYFRSLHPILKFFHYKHITNYANENQIAEKR